MKAVRLETDHLVEPLAVASLRPLLSWGVEDPRPGARPTAYEVVVERDGEPLWETGKVAAGIVAGVRYAGKTLRSRDFLTWRVRVWDTEGKPGPWAESFFGAGLHEDWRADWIGAPEPVPPVRQANNGYHSEMERQPEATKRILLDLGSAQQVNALRLWPARPYDWRADVPGFLFPLRWRIRHGETPDCPEVALDRTGEDTASPGTEPLTVPFPAVRARYLCLETTLMRGRGDGLFGVALAEMQALSGEKTVPAVASATDSIESKDWSIRHLTDGDLRSHGLSGLESLPVTGLRRSFEAEAAPVRAVLYATALGAYAARINGQRVGDQVLAPEWTDYATRVQYQAYDVTHLVHKGTNEAFVELGDGWYAGRLGMAQALDPRGYPRGVYGRQAFFRAVLDLHMPGGEVVSVKTGPGWEATNGLPRRTSDILDGEFLDLTLPEPAWKPALATKEPNGRPAPKVVAQPNEPIRVVERLAPKSVSEPRPGLVVLDFGQNLAGRMTATLRGAPGSRVELQFAEVLEEDGTVYTANLRGAPQKDLVVLGPGGEAAYAPEFTYHGFRYVQLAGLEGPGGIVGPQAEAFCSTSPEVGSFSCSDPMVSRLWQNIRWTTRANLMSVPTDCPQRDERLGWTGDLVAFGQTMACFLDTDAFFAKWLADLRDSQASDGRYPDFAPHPYGKDRAFTGAPGWGDAGIVCAWAHYWNSGDLDAMREHLPSMRRYLDWLAAANPDGVWRNARHNDYGDWLNGDTLRREGWDHTGSEMPKEAFATAMWHQSATLLAKIAQELGEEKDAAKYAAMAGRVKAAFQKAYVAPDGTVLGDTQAGYAIALHFGLVPEALRPAALDKLAAAIERRGGHLSTGFHSTHPMLEALSSMGRHDLAASILRKKTFPSWGYTIENGATSVWERWDGYVAGRGFQDPGMNSFNHWALGSVGQWLFERVGGLAPAAPGWRRLRVSLVPTPGLEWAESSRLTAGGLARVRWEWTGGGLVFTVEVPAGCEAELSAAPSRWLEGAAPPGRVLPPGRYRFVP